MYYEKYPLYDIIFDYFGKSYFNIKMQNVIA